MESTNLEKVIFNSELLIVFLGRKVFLYKRFFPCHLFFLGDQKTTFYISFFVTYNT